MKIKQGFTIAAVSLMTLGAASAAWAFDGQQYGKDAKISLDQARAIALKAVPGGTIADQELEHEKGGSGLRYSFDLKVGQSEREIGVDAVSGKVLEDSIEGADKD